MRILRQFILLIFALSFKSFAFGNIKDSSESLFSISNTNNIDFIPIHLPILISNKTSGINCDNSTFYMHVSNPGNKILLHQVQGLLDGSFIAVGELVTVPGSREGFIIKLDNNGNILSQNILRINNTPVSIQGVKINQIGTTTMTGIMQGSNSVFVVQLSNTLSTNWVETISIASSPIKVTLHALEQESYALAIQTQFSVVCFQLNPDGSILWNKEIVSPGLVKLFGFANMIVNGHGVVTLNFRNGRYETEVTSISSIGNIVSTHIIGNGIDESKVLGISSFGLRMFLLSIKKNNSGVFNLVRNKQYNSSIVETEHQYQVAGSYDFNTTGAIANGGDAMGICTPQNGKLLFIKQFYNSQTSVEFSKQYNVPLGSKIVALTRGYDGGYLFGLNASDSSEFIFLKTDTTGIISGCAYQSFPITSSETLNLPNTIATAVYNTVSSPAILGNTTLIPTPFASNFDCRENYCPAAPPEDTCQATYYKNMVSGAFSHFLNSESLMRGNNLLFGFTRVDNILENSYNQRRGLKLYDEGGHYIKGIYIGEQVSPNSSYYRMEQISDSTVLHCTVTYVNTEMYVTFRVFSDSLNLISAHSFKAPLGTNINSGGVVIGDIHKDIEGNFYLCGTADGVLGIDPKLIVFKVSSSGVPLWVKKYSILGGGYLLDISMTSTATSLIFVMEGGSQGSVSARLDKNTGQMLNAFKYQNSGGGNLFNRLLTFDQGHIFYAGQNANSKYTMGSFDSTGRPYKLKYINESSTFRSAYVKNGKLYSSFPNTNYSADIMITVDSSLNVVTANLYSNLNYSSNIVVGNSGNIYTSGFYTHGPNNNYYDPFIRKYDANGKLGLCASLSFAPTVVNINNLNITPLTFSQITLGTLLSVMPLPVNISADFYGHGIGSIICSTAPTCNIIDITGPTSICQLNVDYTYPYIHNSGCNLLPQVLSNPNIVQVQNITDTTIVVKFINTGTVWIKTILNSGCSKFVDSIQVQVQSGGSVTLGPDKFLCTGDTLILNAGNGFSSYTWQDGTTGNTFVVTHGGQYYVRVGNSCGELLTDTISVTESIIPPLSIGNDRAICKGDTISIAATQGFASYSWLPASQVTGNGPQVQTAPMQDEQFTVHAITSEGCNAYDTINISVKQARLINLGIDTSFCSKDSIILNAGTGYTQYAWSNNNTTNTIVVNSPGSYFVSATDVNGCIARDTLVVLNVYSLPNVDLGPDFNLCVNENRVLDAGNFSNFLWQDNTNTRFYTARNIGKYFVTVTDQNSCSVKDSVEIKNIFPLPHDFIIGPDSICTYEKIELKTNIVMKNYLWSNGISQPTLTITMPGIYTLAATDINGCKGKDTIQIFQKNCIVGVFIPNAFTPNGDIKNDVFKAQVFGIVESFKLEVFNRYGQLIFVSNDPKKGWDGKFKGLEQNYGVYVWQCNYQLKGKAQTTEKGTVILIR